MKILGITFEHSLGWDTHISNLAQRIRPKLSMLRKVAKNLTTEQFLKVATAQLYSILYYASPVWLNQTLKSTHWQKLRTIHYRILRVAVKDYKKRIPNHTLDRRCLRATPKMWSYYSTSSIVIKILRDRSPGFLCDEIKLTLFTTRRQPDKARFYNNSRGKVGLHRLSNRLTIMNGLSSWLNKDLTDDAIRRLLKSDLNFNFDF